MKLRVIAIAILITVVGTVLTVLIFQRNTDTVPRNDSSQGKSIETAQQESRLILGSSTAPVTLKEYIDYKCPNCNKHHRTTGKEITDTYITTGVIANEIKLTPIIGPDSGRAARGAYCAQEQGVFAAYHEATLDYMWMNYYESGNYASEFEDILTTTVLQSIVTPFIGDQESFTNCIESDRYNAQLDRNLNDAADDRIQGTPGFVIGTQSFVGAQPLSVFETLIEIAQRQ